MEFEDSLFISGLFDNIYVNKCSYFGQNGIFRSDNVTLVIPDGNSIIRDLPIQCLLLLGLVSRPILTLGDFLVVVWSSHSQF